MWQQLSICLLVTVIIGINFDPPNDLFSHSSTRLCLVNPAALVLRGDDPGSDSLLSVDSW